MTGENMSDTPLGKNSRERRNSAARDGEKATAQAGIGNTGFAVANAAGRITLMSLSSTWVLTGAAPWFWPLTNLVGP